MATPQQPTNAQSWTAAQEYFQHYIASTTLAYGADQTLPTSTITVASTANYPTSGSLIVVCTARGLGVTLKNGGWAYCTYTGVSGNTFTGVTWDNLAFVTGLLLRNTKAVYAGYKNGAYRRLVNLSLTFDTVANGDQAAVAGWSFLNGNLFQAVQAGVKQTQAAEGVSVTSPLILPVDPLGLYAVVPTIVGAGTITQQHWVEVDF